MNYKSQTAELQSADCRPSASEKHKNTRVFAAFGAADCKYAGLE
ncbi:hypothetical protein [Prevotella sp. kh1p2]|nr:hypothetical protein [Prevotella sp. kh1p2]